MNTRLQVEHPVTEMITGIDLVEQMIRVAAGEKLALRQQDVKLNGWAVESRVYAEDPTRNFLPSTGRLTRYRPPAEGRAGEATVRNDTGVEEGGEISIYYDPMIAKLVTHAGNRATAIAAQAKALDAFVIEGIRHNIPFLSALMAHPRWQAGKLSTGFIAEEFPDGFVPPEPDGEAALHMAAVAIAVDPLQNLRKRQISDQGSSSGRFSFTRDRVAMLGPKQYAATVSGDADLGALYETAIAFAGNRHSIKTVSSWKPGEPVWQGIVNGRDIAVQVTPILNGYALRHAGFASKARVYTAREAELAGLMLEKVPADTSRLLLCPMPGLVKAIAVSEGQEVKAGETLAVVEAMKMENVLRAERDLKIAKLNAKPGDSLAVDAVIMEFA
jgi:propionyl-CoA carboxylase alpha chain